MRVFAQAQKVRAVTGYLCGNDNSGAAVGTIYLRVGTEIVEITHYIVDRKSRENQLFPRLRRSICGKLCFSDSLPLTLAAMPPFCRMFQVSRDTPAYYLTSVANHRLPIFQKDSIKKIVCDAFDEARKSAGIMIFAYVIMPDHTHVLTDNAREMKEALRYLNGISAKRLINYLKENGYESSLAKLRAQERGKNHKHSVYEHHPNALRITGEDALMQKVNYIHLNPVRAGLVEHPDEYLYSSSRQWHGGSLENEPLITDHKQIKWRPAA